MEKGKNLQVSFFFLHKTDIHIHLRNFNLSDNDDALTIYDGDSESDDLIGKYCGSIEDDPNKLPPDVITSSFNAIYIHFSTGYRSYRGYSWKYNGFKLNF